ncbi:MAG: helix-turn-helix domain-containing protein [Myxococcales bacterium]|nr:helix-turn-helix domain-containing protein [Myxococcales bacterium]
MEASAILLPLPAPDPSLRWFSARGFVEPFEDRLRVWFGGTLIGDFDRSDRASRDSIMLHLASAPKAHYGRLAAAFGVSEETLRLLRKQRDAAGLAAVIGRRRPGRPAKVTPELRDRVEGMFADGKSIEQTTKLLRKKLSVSTVTRLRKQWGAARASASLGVNDDSDGRPLAAPSGDDDVRDAGQMELLFDSAPIPESTSGSETTAEEESDAAPDPRAGNAVDADVPSPRAIRPLALRSERNVQHAGAWILLALVASEGLYERAREALDQAPRKKRLSLHDLYIAIDAVVLALAIGERSVEGVRRLATPSAKTLLRAQKCPSAPWVRSRLAEAAADDGGIHFHSGVAADLIVRASQRTDESRPVVFYIDGHVRPYTGKKTVRKGWRMQDRRARPGISDYYLHDEDGRPVMRVDIPEHGSLTDWVHPLGESVREVLGPGERALFAFDRGGSFPNHIAMLRDADFEVVTYERKPYRKFTRSLFSSRFGGEPNEILVHDTRKNLGRGRGRVRRIALLMPNGDQVNLLTTSDLEADTLYAILRHRWRQENGFKHSNERWGINQLDGRRTEQYPPDTIIPNPARRRLDRSLQLARQREGTLRNKIARTATDAPKYRRLEDELEVAVEHRQQLESLRPNTPPYAPLEDTELAGKLARHPGEYKMVIDTIRVACANAESDLAMSLPPRLTRPTEAKKLLANLMKAPADVRAGARAIVVTLAPAATAGEQAALRALLARISAQRLTLPRDRQARQIEFRLQEN